MADQDAGPVAGRSPEKLDGPREPAAERERAAACPGEPRSRAPARQRILDPADGTAPGPGVHSEPARKAPEANRGASRCEEIMDVTFSASQRNVRILQFANRNTTA